MALLMGLFMQPAMAETSTNDDLAFAFGAPTDTLQIEVLTAQEMEATQGEWVFVAVAAAKVGYQVYKSAAARSVTRALLQKASIAYASYKLAGKLDNKL